jgi:aminocarboxymuconate-semialdehyde decarboxylase
MFHTCAAAGHDHDHSNDHVNEQTYTRIARSPKGRSLRIDIHCHYLNPDVNAKVAHLGPHEKEPSIIYGNPFTRETNIKQMKERAGKLSDIEVRLKDMDRMGINIQAVSPAPSQYYYWADPGFAAELAREQMTASLKSPPPTPIASSDWGRCPCRIQSSPLPNWSDV